MSKISIPTLLIAVLVILILLTYMCTYQVRFHEVAVKVRLGKATDESVIEKPGLMLRWPWPIEAIQSYDTRLRTLDTPETEIKTVDGKNVIVGMYAVWHIEEPLKFYKRVRTVAEAQRQMRSRIAAVEAAVVGQSMLSDFVNLDRERLNVSYDNLLQRMLEYEIEEEGEQRRIGVREELLRDYGIAVETLGIRRISLPQETMQQIFEAMKQERNKIAAGYRQEGQSRAEGIKARAEANATSILAFAERRAQEIRSAGVQASTRILEMIPTEDREFFEWLRWLDALRAALAQRTTIFLDPSSPLFEPFANPPVPEPGND